MLVAIYARISTPSQDLDNQLITLRDYCDRMNHIIVEEYTDTASGSSKNRDGFKQMLNDASQRKFDLLVFYSLDRFSREGVKNTLKYLEILNDYGVDFKSYTEQYLDTSGFFKDAIISFLAAIAQQEKAVISDRVKEGIQRAKEKNPDFKIGRPKIEPKIVCRINGLKKEGLSGREIGRQLSISHNTVAKYLEIN
jgi:DNA invertase Pin-like site-specific DNA recombinase